MEETWKRQLYLVRSFELWRRMVLNAKITIQIHAEGLISAGTMLGSGNRKNSTALDPGSSQRGGGNEK